MEAEPPNAPRELNAYTRPRAPTSPTKRSCSACRAPPRTLGMRRGSWSAGWRRLGHAPAQLRRSGHRPSGARARCAQRAVRARKGSACAPSPIRPLHLAGAVRAPFPVLYADTFFLEGDLRKKAGHLQPGESVPRAARWQNGWGFVLLLEGQVFYDFGTIRPEHLKPFGSRRAYLRPGDPGAGAPGDHLRPPTSSTLAGLHRQRRCPVRPNERLWAGPRVNGILAAFWGLAADRAWCPEF